MQNQKQLPQISDYSLIFKSVKLLPMKTYPPCNLELPHTINLLKNEYHPDFKLEQGYVFYEAPEDLDFRYYGRVNIDNNNLWDLFTALYRQIPGPIQLAIRHYSRPDEYWGVPVGKQAAYKWLEQFRLEITKDPFLEIRVYKVKRSSIEVLGITTGKDIQYYCGENNKFLQTMQKFQLVERDILYHVDEVMSSREPYILHNHNAMGTWMLIDHFEQTFIDPYLDDTLSPLSERK